MEFQIFGGAGEFFPDIYRTKNGATLPDLNKRYQKCNTFLSSKIIILPESFGEIFYWGGFTLHTLYIYTQYDYLFIFPVIYIVML